MRGGTKEYATSTSMFFTGYNIMKLRRIINVFITTYN